MLEQLKEEKKVIDGVEYKVQPLGAMTGRKVIAKMIRVLSPALSQVGDQKLDFAKALQGLDEDTIEYFCDLFAERTRVENGTDNKGAKRWPLLKDVFDTHFARRYSSLVKWLAFCLEVNFGDFFGEIRARLRKKEEGAASSIETEQTDPSE